MTPRTAVLRRPVGRLGRAVASLASVLILLCAAPAWAQDAPPDDTGTTEATPGADGPRLPGTLDDGRFSAELRAGVWIPRLGGTTSLGGGEIDVAENLRLDASEAVFNGELTLRTGRRWQIRVSGFDFSTSATGTYQGLARTFGAVSLTAGDAYFSRVRMTSVAAEAGYALFRPVRPEGGDGTRLDFLPIGGIRYLDADQRIEEGGTRQDAGGEWVALYGGLELQYRFQPAGGLPWGLGHALQVDAAFLLGAAVNHDGGFMWEVRAGLTYELTPNLGATFGYRLLEPDFEKGAFEFGAGLQGLYLAGVLRF